MFTLSTAPRVSTDMFLGIDYNGADNGHSLHNFIKSEIKAVLSTGLCSVKAETQLKKEPVENIWNNGHRAQRFPQNASFST